MVQCSPYCIEFDPRLGAMNKRIIYLILHYLSRVVPKGPAEAEELGALIDYLRKQTDV